MLSSLLIMEKEKRLSVEEIIEAVRAEIAKIVNHEKDDFVGKCVLLLADCRVAVKIQFVDCSQELHSFKSGIVALEAMSSNLRDCADLTRDNISLLKRIILSLRTSKEKMINKYLREVEGQNFGNFDTSRLEELIEKLLSTTSQN